ncbi:glycosyltransferase family 2 protein [Flavisphingomonas formosensis]|uniref:glycosyltransferase family 2 protein n=1 Tax=Flavisphingomonas formosensis TaxID=861534 RepID=UPI0012FCD7FB|nr:glycosyltransferase family 2 protein [Sphingomonas formosensis]
MSRDPVVSVIMPAYRGATLVGETIESVLAQTMGDFELIVVDDCSPDDTREVLRTYTRDPRVRLIEAEENQGPVKTRNRAFAAARGRYIAGLDQDDICLPDRFARQAAYLDAHPETVIVAAKADKLIQGRRRPDDGPPVTTPGFLRWLSHLRNPLVWSTAMIRGASARALSPFTRPEILFAEDFDLYHRIGKLGTIARIDEPLLLYRCHPGGASKAFTAKMMESAEAVLTGVYAPIFGEGSAEAARLVTLHVSGGQPVPDIETLNRINSVLFRVYAALTRRRPFDDVSEALIQDYNSRLWWKLARTSLRSGKFSLGAALSVRPGTARIRPGAATDLVMSRLIGSGRTIRKRA